MNWVKSLGWIRTLGLVLGAILLALAASKVANKKSSAKRKESKAEDLLNSGISSKLQKGKKLIKAAQKDKDQAVAAHERMESQLEKLGEANEDLDSLADRFNSRRVRERSSHTAT